MQIAIDRIMWGTHTRAVTLYARARPGLIDSCMPRTYSTLRSAVWQCQCAPNHPGPDRDDWDEDSAPAGVGVEDGAGESVCQRPARWIAIDRRRPRPRMHVLEYARASIDGMLCCARI